MALDPHMEDYLRLCLHYVAKLDASNPFEAARAANSFADQYQTKRDALKQTDADRAFGLVVKATELIDYTLPFSDESGAEALIEEARGYLREALELDADCFDAKRMLKAAEAASPNDYQQFLASEREAVKTRCFELRDAIQPQDAETDEMARLLALRPYLRWLAAEAFISLICGRYKISAALCQEALALEEGDPADVSFTLALALAKLENETALKQLVASHPQTHGTAWFKLAQASLAFKLGNHTLAEERISELVEKYPQAALTLSIQNDIPDGVFARIQTEPDSADELILATSEATVLLQEGCDTQEHGTLGAWIANLSCVREAL